MFRNRLLVGCAVAAAALIPICPVQAGELVAADTRGGLWLYGAETASRMQLGDLGTEFIGLAFAPDGGLYGLEEDGGLWSIELPSGAAEEVSQGAGPDRFQYRDLAFGDTGQIAILRYNFDTRRSELGRRDLLTGEEEGFAITIPGGSDLDAYAIEPFGGDEFLVMNHRDVYSMSVGQGRATFTGFSFPQVVASALAVDYANARGWVLSDLTDGEPGLQLVAVDGASQGLATETPAYRFPFAVGPRAMAFRPSPGNCPRDPQTLCLQNGRFQLRVEWRDFDGNEGRGMTVLDRSDTAGQFWFFDEDNRELLVKVIDGCGENGHFWVFLAGTTNVEHEFTVTDLATGAEKAYAGALGQPVPTRLDTVAFACGAESGEDN
ncbi:MAG: hypothetical protein AAGM22_20175 [Acidobacteriota bacterium]